MPEIGVPLGHRARVELDRLLVRPSPSEEVATEHALDIRVRERDPLTEREARDRPRGVRADARQGVELRDRRRQPVCRHAGDPMEIARAAVVPEPRPLAEHRAERCGGQRAERGEATDEPVEGRRHARGLGLLEHHFRHEHLVRIVRPAPRQIPRGPAVMGQKAGADRV